MHRPETIRWQSVLQAPHPKAVDLITAQTGLSGMQVKRLMAAGGVWLLRPRQPGKRLRRATAPLLSGDEIRVFYDPLILAAKVPPAVLIEDGGCFSVWFKPPGMMSQGNEWGDQSALLRFSEVYFKPQRPVFLVHRLDREAMGLMVIAHQQKAAANLSRQWQERSTLKRYRALVKGIPVATAATISEDLDGKTALSSYRTLREDSTADQSLLEVTIESGRKHQIRRHLEHIGHPVMGDPRYGELNKNIAGLALAAVELGFAHPVSGRPVFIKCPESLLPEALCLSGGECP